MKIVQTGISNETKNSRQGVMRYENFLDTGQMVESIVMLESPAELSLRKPRQFPIASTYTNNKDNNPSQEKEITNMKTRKLLFTLIAAMTMVFGLTLTAHAEEASATKVVGVEGIGTFTVPADWTEEYIEGYGTYWFNPTKTVSVAMSTTGELLGENPPIDIYAAIEKQNLEAIGYNCLQWNITKYFAYDSIEYIAVCPGSSNFSVDYPVLNEKGYSYGHEYYVNNYIADVFSGATTIEELQVTLPILATYQPAK